MKKERKNKDQFLSFNHAKTLKITYMGYLPKVWVVMVGVGSQVTYQKGSL